jgi:hypothetical protein
MSYTVKNYKTKKELIADFNSGKEIKLKSDRAVIETSNGTIYLEGPHYPAPHTWYAQAEIVDWKIMRIK